MTAQCSGYVNPQMTCSSLEFSLAQWLEHLTSVSKVVGQIPIWSSEFFLCSCLATHIIQVTDCAFPFRFPMMNVGMNPFLGQQVSCVNNLSSALCVLHFLVLSQIECTMWANLLPGLITW